MNRIPLFLLVLLVPNFGFAEFGHSGYRCWQTAKQASVDVNIARSRHGMEATYTRRGLFGQETETFPVRESGGILALLYYGSDDQQRPFHLWITSQQEAHIKYHGELEYSGLKLQNMLCEEN
jgi:hypothetical protein